MPLHRSFSPVTGFTSLVPAASVAIPSEDKAVSLTPDQATEIDLETAGVEDGTTKLLRVTQGGSGFAVTFASGIVELGAAVASAISTEANKVTYVSFIFNSDASRWEAYSVDVET